MILYKSCINKSPCKASQAELLCNGRPRRRRLSPWKRVSYVVRVDVCVIPLQAVIQDGDDHSFPRDALLPHRDHVQVQLGQRGRRPRVLLENRSTNSSRSISQRLMVSYVGERSAGKSLPDCRADLCRNSLLDVQPFLCQGWSPLLRTLISTYSRPTMIIIKALLSNVTQF